MKFPFISLLFTCILTNISGQVDTSTTIIGENTSLADILKIKVSVASNNSVTVFNSPSTVSVIDQKMIQDFNFLSLSDALSSVSGVDVYQTIIDKNVPTFRGILQNFYANKVLLLINNKPTWQPIYGEGYIDRISINDVQQIEILKGPASVFYGSNAYTGVINLVLNTTEKTSVTVNNRFGYPLYFSNSVQASIAKKDTYINLHFNNKSEKYRPYMFTGDSDSDKLYLGDSVFNYEGYNQVRSFTFSVNHTNHEALINVFNHNHSYFGAHPSYISGGGTAVDNNGLFFSYSYTNSFNGFDFRYNLNYDYFVREFSLSYDRNTLIHLAGDKVYNRLSVNYELLGGLNLEYGIDADFRNNRGHETRSAIADTLIRSNFIPLDSLHNNYLSFKLIADDTEYPDDIEFSNWLQANFKYKKFLFIGGIRYTYNLNFKQHFAGRFSSIYHFDNHNAFKLIIGQAYRVPTLFELYFYHPTVNGNQKLKPEENLSFELAYQANYGNFYIQALLYNAYYKNIIKRTPDKNNPTGPPIYNNIESIETFGSETDLKYQVTGNWGAYISYNNIFPLHELEKLFLTMTHDAASDNLFDLVPNHKINTGIFKYYKQFCFSINSKYYSSVNGLTEKINGQFIGNLNVHYKKAYTKVLFTHSITIENITNSKQYTPEYIRLNNVNKIPTILTGVRFVYGLKLNI